MNVIVPLGGLGSRFQKEGYSRPKPFVRVLGKEMIIFLLDALHLQPEDSLVIVFNPAFLSMDVFMRDIVQRKYPQCTLVELAGPTRGAAETVLFGLLGLPNSLRSRPCMLCDGDTFFTRDIVSMYREVSTTSNATFCFEDTQPNPIYSYVIVGADDTVTDIKEKVKISDHANTGCYCFRDGIELQQYCEKIIEAGAMQLSQDMQGEFYTSGVIKAMLDDQIPCKMLRLKTNDFHVLGTPKQVKSFCSTWPDQPGQRVVFTLVGTLVTPPTVGNDYSTVQPIERNVNYARQLFAQGHCIVLWNIHLPAADQEALARRVVALDIPHHKIDWTRPDVDFFFDASTMDTMQGALDTQIGFYPSKVLCSRTPAPPQSPSSSVLDAAAQTLAGWTSYALSCLFPKASDDAERMPLRQ